MRRVFCRCSPLEESVPPPGFEFPSQGPINQETFCAGVVLAVLRAYGPGAEKSRIAQWSGLDQDHVEKALRYLKAQGYAERQTRSIPWYYRTREAHFWVEKPRKELLGRPMPRFEEPPTEPHGIPPRFWWVFWSGTDPMFLRLPDHAWYVASRMLAPEGSRRHLSAETWALKHLPSWALRKLSQSRGYQHGPVAERIKLRLSKESRHCP